MKVISPAKVNLMLRILGKREDGYHLLQTYFQLLNWGDEMQFNLSENNQICVSGEFNNLAQQDNLIYKAAELLMPHNKSNSGIEIKVNKVIPQGSGLGGGSSNAGTTLRYLNKLWDCQLSHQQLQKYAITLGADVPIFLLNQSAMATGIGEKLTPYELEKQFIVLIFPKTSIKTVDVFNDPTLIKNQMPIELTQINQKKHWKNACLPIVINNYQEVAEMFNSLSELNTTYMSGTGSTLFCCFDNETEANELISVLPKQWHVILTQSK
ncbi:MAG: 4-(cytidine 5'-diphospho)-2-C-methyl-D-erythritol kinase [Marinicellaceae bacterium]